jgi:hypothetical protein
VTGFLAVDCTDAATQKLLQDSKRHKEAFDNLLLGDHHAANAGSTQMWEFIWIELMLKVVPAPGRAAANLFHESYHLQVDAAALMKHVNVSDEALVLTILSVHGGSFTSSAGRKTVTTMMKKATTAQVRSQTTVPTKKMTVPTAPPAHLQEKERKD